MRGECGGVGGGRWEVRVRKWCMDGWSGLCCMDCLRWGLGHDVFYVDEYRSLL